MIQTFLLTNPPRYEEAYTHVAPGYVRDLMRFVQGGVCEIYEQTVYLHVFTKWGEKRVKIETHWWKKVYKRRIEEYRTDWHNAGF